MMIEVKRLSKTYCNGKTEEVHALKDVNYSFSDNGMYFIVGKSGSGKSTLLSTLGLLEKQTQGALLINGETIMYGSKRCRTIRQNDIGYVFQDFNLLNDFSVIENVSIVSEKAGAERIIDSVGLSNKKNTPVKNLSGGEKQRLAIARMIAKESRILLLDEPTGNLDDENTTKVFDLLSAISKKRLVIVVTHDLESMRRYADKVIELRDGEIVSFYDNKASMRFLLRPTSVFSDEIVVIYNVAIQITGNNNLVTFQVNSHETNTSKTVSIHKNELFNFLIQTYQQEIGKEVEILVLAEKPQESARFDEYKRTDNFKLKMKFKYAVFLLRSKRARLLSTITLMFLSLLLLFVQLNITFFKSPDALYNAFNKTDVHIIPYEQKVYNAYSDQYVSVRSGQDLYNLSQQIFNNILLNTVAIVEDDAFTPLNIHVYDSQFAIETLDYQAEMISDDGILITDYIAYQYFGRTQISEGDFISVQLSHSVFNMQSISLKVKGIIKTDFEKLGLQPSDCIANYDLGFKYRKAYLNIETYLNIVKDLILYIPASNFLHANNNMPFYINQSLNYYKYSNDMGILMGRAPKEINEVVVSSSFLQKNNIHDLEQLEQVFEKDFSFKDINASPNKTLYQEVISLYDISSAVKIVGVVGETSSSADIYTSLEFWDEFIPKLQYFYFEEYVTIFDGNKAIFDEMDNNNLTVTYDFTKPIYGFDNVKNSTFQTIIFAVEVILLCLATLSLFYFCYLNVAVKIKEISILKSLGIQDRSIATVFFMQNFMQVSIACVLGISSGVVGLLLLNNVLKSPDVLNISYNFFPLYILSFATVILSTFLFAFLATIIPFMRIRKLEIFSTLKGL